MAMPQTLPAQGEWTVEEMWRLPEDGNRYEVIDGVLYVTPSPSLRHQDAAGALYRKLAAYLETQSVGWVYIAPSDVVFTPRRSVEPDVYVAPLVLRKRPRSVEDVKHLVLAIEILSPSTAARDRGVKRRLYQQHTDEYWIVDLDARIIERWRAGDERPEILDGMLTWQPAGADALLAVDLPTIFREVCDD
jgi:Uma2 family endonuclease